MTLGAILQVALILTLTYLMLALMGAAFQELVAGLLKLRARQLTKALTWLICDGALPGGPLDTLLEHLITHPLLNTYGDRKEPSYIPARNFASALLYLLSRECHQNAAQPAAPAAVYNAIKTTVKNLPESPVKRSMQVFLSRAGEDIELLQHYVQTWFDDAMDRLTGEYKRWSQVFLMGFGLVTAIGLNADSLRMASVLRSEGPTTGETRLENADEIRQWMEKEMASKPAGSGNVAAPLDSFMSAMMIVDRLSALRLPIGWDGVEKEFSDAPDWHDKALIALRMVIGWIMTALAVSLGAPFWFDTLNRIYNLRAAGPKPSRAFADAAAANVKTTSGAATTPPL